MFISMNMLEIIQILSVFFGTLVAAPLIVSKKAKKRMIGLFAVIAGSFFAIIVQIYLGLYYFVFANLFWLLNACNGIKKILKTKRKNLVVSKIIIIKKIHTIRAGINFFNNCVSNF